MNKVLKFEDIFENKIYAQPCAKLLGNMLFRNEDVLGHTAIAETRRNKEASSQFSFSTSPQQLHFLIALCI